VRKVFSGLRAIVASMIHTYYVDYKRDVCVVESVYEIIPVLFA
jgi:hypothetical protein